MKFLNETLLVIPSGANERLSPHFTSSEFEDGMSDYLLIDERLLDLLEALREELGKPIKITSGYRSEAKQAALKASGYETAKGISTHMVGAAVDLKCNNLSGVKLEAAARKVGFKAVGVGKSFIHVDLRVDSDRRWVYKG